MSAERRQKVDEQLAQAVSQDAIQQAQQARATVAATPAPAPAATAGLGRRLPPRPAWMDTPEQASMQNSAAIAEMRALQRLKAKKT